MFGAKRTLVSVRNVTKCLVAHLMPGLHTCRDSMRQYENERVKGRFVLPHSRPVLVSSRSTQRHAGELVPSQRNRACLMSGLHSYRDSTKQDEKESVKGTFVSFSTLSICSYLVLKISETCWWISPKSKETRMSQMSCLVIDNSHTRV